MDYLFPPNPVQVSQLTWGLLFNLFMPVVRQGEGRRGKVLLGGPCSSPISGVSSAFPQDDSRTQPL